MPSYTLYCYDIPLLGSQSRVPLQLDYGDAAVTRLKEIPEE